MIPSYKSVIPSHKPVSPTFLPNDLPSTTFQYNGYKFIYEDKYFIKSVIEPLQSILANEVKVEPKIKCKSRPSANQSDNQLKTITSTKSFSTEQSNTDTKKDYLKKTHLRINFLEGKIKENKYNTIKKIALFTSFLITASFTVTWLLAAFGMIGGSIGAIGMASFNAVTLIVLGGSTFTGGLILIPAILCIYFLTFFIMNQNSPYNKAISEHKTHLKIVKKFNFVIQNKKELKNLIVANGTTINKIAYQNAISHSKWQKDIPFHNNCIDEDEINKIIENYLDNLNNLLDEMTQDKTSKLKNIKLDLLIKLEAKYFHYWHEQSNIQAELHTPKIDTEEKLKKIFFKAKKRKNY